MNGDETWYTVQCVLYHFYDNHMYVKNKRHFSILLIVIGGLPHFTEIKVVACTSVGESLSAQRCQK
jgi:hypothetical protein